MQSTDLETRLTNFQKTYKLNSKGKLSAILYLSRLARRQGLPLDSSVLVTGSKGQVQGLGKAAVQTILSEYGITRVLAEEAGRTSRGSLGYMRDYVAFLNDLHAEGVADVDEIERWWVDRISDYFNAQPFILRYDTGKSLRSMVRDLLAQAFRRQRENPGTMYAGAVLQHLIGAKLQLILPEGSFDIHGFSVADAAGSRSGDFLLDDVVIHATTAPGEALMRKCQRNLEQGHRPIIVTTSESMAGAESLAAIQGIAGRVDILEAEQFLAANVYELSRFQASGRKVTIELLVAAYNQIVEHCETDPSLSVTVG
ncbi:MAG: DUF4928 family protein [Bryobacteraceae bacterium]